MPSIANKFKVGDRIVCETASGWKYEGVVKSVDAGSDTVTYTCVDPVWRDCRFDYLPAEAADGLEL
ncbi:hypothetical protein PBI_GAIA_131 [Mycobacterium phage Gaia]|uniref:Uncharacterized protein n=1 Tax=Mycobacterium phage Gaia TaxID=1486472 RepID=A0A068F8W1_9CAUD|nr:hypothetical protein VC46_gp102 [Mycobacterium phage Gaia]AID58950.1 hypothetical protein PBI_GAIA_131 [Mycobacterium phage Gaia]